MPDSNKTKKELIKELSSLRRRVSKLEKLETKCNQAQETSEESEQIFRNIFEGVKDAIIYLDKKAFILNVNKIAVVIFGGTKKELIGKHFTKIGIFSLKDIPQLMSNFKKIIAGKESNIELKLKNKKGNEIYLECKTSLTKTNGKITGTMVVARDITEWKKAEIKLQGERDKLKQIFKAMDDGIYIVNQDYDIEYVNPVLIKDFGPYEDRKCYEYFHDRDEVCPWCKNQDVFAGKTARWEWYSFKNGKTYDLIDNPLKNADGTISKLEIFRDITERKQVEEALRESEVKLKSIFKATPIGIGLVVDRVVKKVNHRLCEMLGYSEDELVNQNARMLYPTDEDYEYVGKEKYKQIREHGTGSVETRWQCKNGEIIDVLLSSTPLNPKDLSDGVTFTALDITERKLAEEKLCENEKKLKDIINHSNEVFYIHDTKHQLSYVSPYSKEVFGYNPDEMMVKWTTLVTDNPINEEGFELTEKAVKTGEKQKPYILEIKRKDGKLRFIEIDESPIKDENGKVIAITGALRDITERKRAEEALRESEERFSLFMDYFPACAFIKDQETRTLFVNKYMNDIFGAKEWLGKTVFELFPPAVAEKMMADDRITLDSGYQTSVEEIPDKNGVIHVYETYKFKLDRQNKPPLLGGIALDITETKRLQALQSRAERLETAGKIAGQVAHDFNNLLGPMIAYPDFLKNELSKNHSAMQMLNDIEKAATMMVDINQQLLTLSRRGHFELETLNLNSVVTQSLNQMNSQPDTLHIEMDLDKNLMNIRGGPAQLSRIISNLVNNALDAMQRVGHLFIKTENYYADDVSGRYGHIPKGEYVKLTITDTGHGITKEALPKIFDPFFTTKKTDKQRGSGLGLSVVHAVMEDHNGYIDLQSEFGQGTSFFLYFPITRDEIETSNSDKIAFGTENILVVDDDTLQREVALNLLKKLGYNATAVDSGERAIEFLRDNPQGLLVLDMVMPGGIDGAETYRKALEINPNQQAIIVSGFAESERVNLAMKLGAGAFIKKPLTFKSISIAVRKELDKMLGES